ncbi:MAG: isochorismatase family protein [Candidatus Eisenbacteria sp.]|nr:isochorismatase family protein [Candidatus Eisenbacteria bacterium]
MSGRNTIDSRAARWREVLAPHLTRPVPKPDPDRTALLVIDAQVHFHEMLNPVLPNILSVLKHFRTLDYPIIFTRHRHVDPAADAGMMAQWWDSLLIDGQEDAELVPELRPRKRELLIEKCRYSAFLATPLEEELRKQRVKNLVISGVMTNLCCETTARDAFMRGFRVYFLLDGTATCTEEYHLATLKNLAYGFAYIVTCEEMLAFL